MTLSPDDARAFFTLWSCIDAFVCRRREVAPGIETPAQMRTAKPDIILRVREALWREPGLLDAFVEENAFGLSTADLTVAAGPDGSTHVAAANIRLLRGTTGTYTLRFTLPRGYEHLEVIPSARYPAIKNTAGAQQWNDDAQRTLNW